MLPHLRKMIPLQAVIQTPRFVQSTVAPMTQIAIDIIGPFSTNTGIFNIIRYIDIFSRYFELFHTTDVSVISLVVTFL